MVSKRLSNPQHFVREAKRKNVNYFFLLEAMKSVGSQATARMFKGRSGRGQLNSLSSATLDNWIKTFEYYNENKNVPDSESYGAISIEPTDEWHKFVDIILKPINVQTIDVWKSLSLKNLGDEALVHSITLGIRNSKSLATLLDRMIETVHRRNSFQLVLLEEAKTDDHLPHIDYNMINVPSLKKMLVQRKINASSLKNKYDMVAALQQDDLPKNIESEIPTKDLSSLSRITLLEVAKDRGLPQYNNLKKESIISLIKQDTLEKDTVSSSKEPKPEDSVKEYSLTLKDGNTFIVPLREDGYVNATLLCKAGNKKFHDWNRLESTKALIQALIEVEMIPASSLIYINTGKGIAKYSQGSWIHPDLAVQLAQWISPVFALQVSRWIRELLTTGTVSIQRPLKIVPSILEADVEAETIEMNDTTKYSMTNTMCLYVAYIGQGLVKIGYSDCRIEERLKKHQSAESQYPQLRILKMFRISSKIIEKNVHCFLTMQNFKYNKQTEVYKPSSTLGSFLDIISTFLENTDTKLQLELARQENLHLVQEILNLKSIILSLTTNINHVD